MNKKRIFAAAIVLICLNLSGCLSKTDMKGTAAAEEKKLPAVMVNDKIYYNMNWNAMGEGVNGDWSADGTITSSVQATQTPAENDQSNFGTGYEYIIADGLYGVLLKMEEGHVIIFQEKDKGIFYYDNKVYEKSELSEEAFEWLSWYNLATKEERADMGPMPEEFGAVGIPMDEYNEE